MGEPGPAPVQHRISAGALVVHEGRVLMVRHQRAGRYDFWVAPGGGVQGAETLNQAAEREVREETDLQVQTSRLLYVEEFFSPETRHCRFWLLATFVGGQLDTSAPEARDEHIVQAAWLTPDELQARTVFPEFLQALFWADRQAGLDTPQYMGLRAMQFW